MKTIAIFDLDGTVIDSSHRHATLPDGSLDLAHWVENSTREKIMQDSLLPVLTFWHDAVRASQTIIVCTARVLSEHDHAFLFHAGMFPHIVLSRPAGCTMGDADLKEFLLRDCAHKMEMPFAQFARSAEMFDDNQSVINRVVSLGITCYNARLLNNALKVA